MCNRYFNLNFIKRYSKTKHDTLGYSQEVRRSRILVEVCVLSPEKEDQQMLKQLSLRAIKSGSDRILGRLKFLKRCYFGL